MALAVVLSTKRLIAAVVVVIASAGCEGSMPPDRVTPLLASLDKAVYTDCGQQRDQARARCCTWDHLSHVHAA